MLSKVLIWSVLLRLLPSVAAQSSSNTVTVLPFEDITTIPLTDSSGSTTDVLAVIDPSQESVSVTMSFLQHALDNGQGGEVTTGTESTAAVSSSGGALGAGEPVTTVPLDEISTIYLTNPMGSTTTTLVVIEPESAMGTGSFQSGGSQTGGTSTAGTASSTRQTSSAGQPSLPGDTSSTGQFTSTGATSSTGQASLPGDTSSTGQSSLPGDTSSMGQSSLLGATSSTGQSSLLGATSATGQSSLPGDTSSTGQSSLLGDTSSTGQSSAIGPTSSTDQTGSMGQTDSTGGLTSTSVTATAGGITSANTASPTMPSSGATLPSSGATTSTSGLADEITLLGSLSAEIKGSAILIGSSTLTPNAVFTTGTNIVSLDSSSDLIVDSYTIPWTELLPVPSATATTTITSLPSDFSEVAWTGPSLTENTWVTSTDSQGHATVLPVIVPCPWCPPQVLQNFPKITGFSINLPKLPKLPTISFPCIPIPFIKSCSSPPKNDAPPVDVPSEPDPTDDPTDNPTNSPTDNPTSATNPSSTNEPTSTERSSTSEQSSTSSSETTTSSSTSCTESSTVTDCGVTASLIVSSSTTSTAYYTVTCAPQTGCDVTATTSTMSPARTAIYEFIENGTSASTSFSTEIRSQFSSGIQTITEEISACSAGAEQTFSFPFDLWQIPLSGDTISQSLPFSATTGGTSADGSSVSVSSTGSSTSSVSATATGSSTGTGTTSAPSSITSLTDLPTLPGGSATISTPDGSSCAGTSTGSSCAALGNAGTACVPIPVCTSFVATTTAASTEASATPTGQLYIDIYKGSDCLDLYEKAVLNAIGETYQPKDSNGEPVTFSCFAVTYISEAAANSAALSAFKDPGCFVADDTNTNEFHEYPSLTDIQYDNETPFAIGCLSLVSRPGGSSGTSEQAPQPTFDPNSQDCLACSSDMGAVSCSDQTCMIEECQKDTSCQACGRPCDQYGF